MFDIKGSGHQYNCPCRELFMTCTHTETPLLMLSPALSWISYARHGQKKYIELTQAKL